MLRMRVNYKEAIKDLRKQVNEVSNAKLLAESQKLVKELRDATPVDTGLAQAAWRAQLEHDGKSNKVNGKVLISNWVPYIGYLNRGHSDQAPPHFIERIAASFGKPRGSILEETE